MDDEEKLINCLKLKLNNEYILFFLSQIQIVLPIAELDPVPNNDLAVEGLLNFHSQFIPVYHLAALINAPIPSYDLNTPIIICSLSSGLIGLLVSEVLEVNSLTKSDIQKPSLKDTFSYVEGVVMDEQNSVCLLDVEKLLIFNKKIEPYHKGSRT